MQSILQNLRKFIGPSWPIDHGHEQYLAHATDLCDLERRMRDIDRECCGQLAPIDNTPYARAPWTTTH